MAEPKPLTSDDLARMQHRAEIQRGLKFGNAPDYEILAGDCRDVMATFDAESVDSIVSDPPYGLSFMGKGWDHGVPGVEFWAEALRVAKPGAHLLAFGGTRTYHRLACAIEDAGWEIRDCVAWVYASGFPKSHDVSKAIDKAAGAERIEKLKPKAGHESFVGRDNMKAMRAGTMAQPGGFARPWMSDPEAVERAHWDYAPATDAARQWAGWGTALKPSYEPVIVARKPLCGTVAQNVLRHGTGGINIDGCRVGTSDNLNGGFYRDSPDEYQAVCYGRHKRGGEFVQPTGRWPANLIHDGSDEVVGLFPNDAARFFYCAKASKKDRDEGCEGLEERLAMRYGEKAQGPLPQQTPSKPVAQRNHHPTVKPTDLMRYLCRLVTPPGGIVLDPFMGSGSTGKAAMLEGFRFIGIEREAEYVEIARARIGAVLS